MLSRAAEILGVANKNLSSLASSIRATESSLAIRPASNMVPRNVAVRSPNTEPQHTLAPRTLDPSPTYESEMSSPDSRPITPLSSVSDLVVRPPGFLTQNVQDSLESATGQSRGNLRSGTPAREAGRIRRHRRGPFRNQQRREETAVTRTMKACIRCHRQKIRVGANRGDLEQANDLKVQTWWK